MCIRDSLQRRCHEPPSLSSRRRPPSPPEPSPPPPRRRHRHRSCSMPARWREALLPRRPARHPLRILTAATAPIYPIRCHNQPKMVGLSKQDDVIHRTELAKWKSTHEGVSQHESRLPQGNVYHLQVSWSRRVGPPMHRFIPPTQKSGMRPVQQPVASVV